GNPTQWLWNFGDGNSSSVKNPTHTYSQHGTYTVTLAISDSATNCLSTHSYTLKTQQNTNNCKAYFYSFPDQTNTNKINFIADSSSGSTYTWNFGDSTIGTGQTIQHTYSSSGVYYVCLTITKTNCTDTYCKMIRVANTGCSSYFNYSKNGKTVSFYGDSTNSANATYTWSFGDNSTGTGQNVQHTYSSFGTYHACLTISHSGMSCTPHCKSITLGTNPSYSSIGGVILAGTNYVDKATAYLIYFNPQDSTLTAIDTFNVDSSGLYYFGNVVAGTYLLKAALRSQSSYYQNYMPTYYDTVLFWNQATDVVCSGNNFVQRNINMLQGNNPGGPGFIGGKVNKGANFRSNYMKGIQIMLVDEFDRPVAYTFSDGKGEFSFENIALGSYKVYAEIIGKISYSANVVIDKSNKTSDNITFTVNDDNISASINNQISDMIKSIGNIYPNPSSNAININVSIIKPVEFNILILNQLGQIVFSTKENLQLGNNIISLEVSQLEMGFYTVLINSSDNSQLVRKFMKIK
ncbi:MAG: PKD domain-containing protein, partial [Bacteroidota bacterium]|nr:PKD domain-containing protein [Bacteroidota bacterium]